MIIWLKILRQNKTIRHREEDPKMIKVHIVKDLIINGTGARYFIKENNQDVEVKISKVPFTQSQKEKVSKRRSVSIKKFLES